MGFSPDHAPTPTDWLSIPTQRLAEFTGGAVHHDDIGELTRLRTIFEFYPDDVWRYVLACQWMRVAQEEPFIGRTAEVGDELGSAVLAARMASDLMTLTLLMHRRYPPYSKWLGSAFGRLPGIAPLADVLRRAVTADDHRYEKTHSPRPTEPPRACTTTSV